MLATIKSRISWILRSLAHSPTAAMYVFGCALIAVTWIALAQLLSHERTALRASIESEVANLSLAIEQNVTRTIREMDRILLGLRKHYEEQGYWADWPSAINRDFMHNAEHVQMAVIDRTGMMITSTAMLHPAKPVDLSDREHYRVHAESRDDRVFISKPLLGRASGKWSVQVTRRLTDAEGNFNGVLVISLDPKLLSRIYGGLSLGTGGGLAVVGIDGIVRAASGIFESVFARGFREGTLIEQKNVHGGAALVSRQIFQGQRQIVAMRQDPTFGLDIVVAAPDVESRPEWHARTLSYVGVTIAFSLLVGMVMIGVGIARRSHDNQVFALARSDLLTGLPNRLGFNEHLEGRLRLASRPESVALHLLDLDGFKTVNDTYGHPFGDMLLKAVSARIRDHLRDGDFVARLGGDEFAIVHLLGSDPGVASVLAERMCRIIEVPFDIDGILVKLGASVGIAVLPRDGSTLPLALRSADLALYASKAEGKGRYKFYSEDLFLAASTRLTLENDLKSAIANAEFELHYQPITCLRTMQVTAYEALLRWRHPERGLVPPMDFIPLAEETGLIVPIGEWVMKRACLDIARFPGEVSVAVNCSPMQFKDPGLVEAVKGALDGSGISPDRLEIEITETTLMLRDQRTSQHLDTLKAMGVRVAMDDFGTGYSSLSYLQSYPINCIKIDRSFVKALGESQGAPLIVKAITTLASGLNMSTIAEGVETKEQLELVARLGCVEAQGYYLGRPKRAEDILAPAAHAPASALVMEAA
jgi:diguanylate cyclase (GGDEF)-like protein